MPDKPALRFHLRGQPVEIRRAAGRQKRYEVTIDGKAAGTGTLRRRRNPSDDDRDADLVYELAVPGRPAIPLTGDDHTALTRARRPQSPHPGTCAGCEGPLDKHGLEGIDLGEDRYCFDCT